MSWFDRITGASLPGFGKDGPASLDAARRKSVPEGIWQKCDGCGAALYGAEMRRNLNVCPRCGHHHALAARTRLEALLDPPPAFREELALGLTAADPLAFRDSRKYPDRLAEAQAATGEEDALVVLRGTLDGIGVVASAFEYAFMGGSMGSVVGEKFTRGVEAAIAHSEPFVCFTASGGARMQESLYSLMQMAKTSAALAELDARGLPYVVVLTNPTMGGVSASLAMLGDLTLAEPGALIGFAGPRVIEQTVRQKLPEGFQRAEFLREKGAIDQIVDRRELRARLASLLAMLTQRPVAEAS